MSGLERTLDQEEEASSSRKKRKTRKKAPYTTPAIRKALMNDGLLFFLPRMTKKQWKALPHNNGIESDEEARKAWSWLHKHGLEDAGRGDEYGS